MIGSLRSVKLKGNLTMFFGTATALFSDLLCGRLVTGLGIVKLNLPF